MNHGGGPFILVNGRAKEAVEIMHYDQAVRAAGFDPARGVLYLVCWETMAGAGVLVPGGEGIETVEGMIIHVAEVGDTVAA